jgi:large subunit ribosomal protein L16
MLEPKRTKHKKVFRGKNRGVALRGNNLSMGEYGLQTLQRAWLNGKQIESARKVIVKEMKRKGKLWIKVFPDHSFTAKPAEVRMGKGKGEVQGYVAVVKPGRILFEISGVTEDVVMEAFRKAGQKLPVLTKVISKNQ